MSNNALNLYVTRERDYLPYVKGLRTEIADILAGLNLKPTEYICIKVDGQEGKVPFGDVVQLYYDGIEKSLISGTMGKYYNPAELLQDTYYEWQKEAARYRDRIEREAINMTIHENPPAANDSDKQDNLLDEEKAREEIELKRSEKEKKQGRNEANQCTDNSHGGACYIICGSILPSPRFN